MTVKESKAYSAMMVREFCYMFDMEKEGYDPTSDIEAVLYELEYGDSEAREIVQTCTTESQVEYTITLKGSGFKYVVGYFHHKCTVYVQVHISPRSEWNPTHHVTDSKWEEGENSLERIAALAVLEYCASRVVDD